jgi:hypothetical protein
MAESFAIINKSKSTKNLKWRYAALQQSQNSVKNIKNRNGDITSHRDIGVGHHPRCTQPRTQAGHHSDQ